MKTFPKHNGWKSSPPLLPSIWAQISLLLLHVPSSQRHQLASQRSRLRWQSTQSTRSYSEGAKGAVPGCSWNPSPIAAMSQQSSSSEKKGTPGCLFRHLPQTSGIEGKASKGVLLSRPLSDFSTMRSNGLGLRYCRYMNNTAVLWGLGNKRV